jgi:hypothetical protein
MKLEFDASSKRIGIHVLSRNMRNLFCRTSRHCPAAVCAPYINPFCELIDIFRKFFLTLNNLHLVFSLSCCLFHFVFLLRICFIAVIFIFMLTV